jgi:hypothetical protein
MKPSKLDILIRAREAQRARDRASQAAAAPAPYDPNGPLDSWLPPKKNGRPKKEVPEISTEEVVTPPKKQVYPPKKPKTAKIPTPIVIPAEEIERTRKVVITLTPAEEKELRLYAYGRDVQLVDWSRMILLEKVRSVT